MLILGTLMYIQGCRDLVKQGEVEQNLFHDDIDGIDLDNENDADSDDRDNKFTFHRFLKDHPLQHSHYHY
jgi:hypothetical protein